MVTSGSQCPKCRAGRMRTISSRQAGEATQLRYLECTACQHRAKSIVSAEHVFRRSTVEPTRTK